LRKIYIINIIILFIISIIFLSCLYEPKEGKYKNYSYEEIIKRHGNPKYDNIYIINNNFELSFIDPNYALYFTKEELENGSQVRKLIWENIFNHRKIIWLKNINGQWIVFDSLEYNSKYIKF
jgi:hypothetical protein